MARTLSYVVTRTTVYPTPGQHSTDVLGVADTHAGGVAYARKLCDRYYAGVIFTERETGWSVTVLEAVIDGVTTRLAVEPILKVSGRTQV
jgi:hypothetical protein